MVKAKENFITKQTKSTGTKMIDANKITFLFVRLTYFSVQAIGHEVSGELLHVAGKTPEGVHLTV